MATPKVDRSAPRADAPGSGDNAPRCKGLWFQKTQKNGAPRRVPQPEGNGPETVRPA